MRFVRSLTAIALLAAVVLPPSPGAAAAACSAMETVSLKTFYLKMKAREKAYEVGDTAIIDVNVSRPSDQDPLGQGIPMDRPFTQPAEEVNVGIGLRVGDVFLFGHGITDENGDAAVEVKLEPWTPAGSAIADGFSWKILLDTPCLRVEENGYRQLPDAFKVTK